MALALAPRLALSETALVAVASNFTEVSEALQHRFEIDSPHLLKLASGSTGQFYAQISNGAPFDLLLAADQARPLRLIEEGHALADSRFTYALGVLTLWSADERRVGESAAQVLEGDEFRILAMANPDLAPYGVAAKQYLVALGLIESLRSKTAQGQNVAQVFSMVATGNADLGLVALSHVLSPRNLTPGVRWDLPTNLYAPIRQDVVLMSRAADNEAAHAFLGFLRSREAKAIIARYGYDIE